MMRRRQDQQSKVFEELSSLILNILRSPPTPIEFYDDSLSATEMSPASSGRRMVVAGSMQQITPAGFASLLLGVSFALMLCGSVTFFIGFLMMPWVLGLVMVFYVAGIVYSLTMIGRAIFSHISSPSSPRKDFQPSQQCLDNGCKNVVINQLECWKLIFPSGAGKNLRISKWMYTFKLLSTEQRAQNFRLLSF